jgi:hypothetical protein
LSLARADEQADRKQELTRGFHFES